MARLGDIATVITKGTTPTSIGFNFQNDGINFVKIESVDENGSFICEKFDHISDECHEKLKRSQLQENDILFSIAGAIGRTAIVTKDILPANTNQALAIIRIPQGVVNYSFLLYILQSSAVLDQAEKKKQGVAQLNLSLKDIGDFIIPDIPLEEQQCIVDSLDKVSNLISLRKQQLSKLDELVKSRFIELFDDDVPTVKLGDVCRMINGDRGKNYPSGDDFVEDGIPFVNAGHLQNRKVDFSDMNYITEEKFNLLSQGKMQEGDILYCLRGSLGKHGLVDFKRGAVASSLVILRCNQERILPEFLLYALETSEIELQLKAANNGSSQPNLSAASVKAYDIKLPAIEQQTEFVAFVEQTDKSKFEIERSLEKLEMLKKALMQKYFE